MNNLSDKYYKQYEQLINQIVTSQHMTFFDKADLLEKRANQNSDLRIQTN